MPSPSAVIFLDVDGVLNSQNTRLRAGGNPLSLEASWPAPELLARLKRITEAASSCGIVLSSSWRLQEEETAAVEAALASAGCPGLYDKTPELDNPRGGAVDRAQEILKWLSQAKLPLRAWVALDDLDLHGWCPELISEEHFELTDDAVGLSNANVESAIAKLHRQLADAQGGGSRCDLGTTLPSPDVPPDVPLVASARTRNADLEDAITASLLPPDPVALPPAPRIWQISWRGDAGRCLTAACDLPAGTVIFRERPLIVAAARKDQIPQAVALALLRDAMFDQEEARGTDPEGRAARARVARTLQEAHFADRDAQDSFEAWTQRVFSDTFLNAEGGAADQPAPTMEAITWALGVASINVHAARSPTRGVLGVAASMMCHSCTPSAELVVASPAEGNVLTLRTITDVPTGGALSISYCSLSLPTAERQRHLMFQYGFRCECERCSA